MSLFASLFLIAVLVVCGAFLSFAEISLAASRKIRLEMMAKEGDASAARVLALQAQPGDFFTVVQIGLNAVAILAGIVGEPVLSVHIADVIGGFYQGPWLQQISFSLSFILVTGIFILFSDLMPKRLAMAAPERVATLVVDPMVFCTALFRPLIWVFNGLSKLFFTVFHLPQVRQEVITSNEIFAVMDAGAQAGVLLRQEHDMIENVFELETRYVPSVMTARESIVFFLLSDTEEQIRQKIIEYPHSKFLICERNIDTVLGYVDTKDVLRSLLQGERFSLKDKALMHQPLTIPDTLNLWEVLERMKAARENFAVAVNEYALVVGIVTLEDVTGTLMGNLGAATEEQQIVKRDENSWLMDGLTPVADVMHALSIEEFPNVSNYETLGGFIMYTLRKIPKKTEFVVFDAYKFEVVDIEGARINQLLVTRVNDKLDTAGPR